MSKVRVLRNKIKCNATFDGDDDSPQVLTLRLPKKERDWMSKNVKGNASFVMAWMLRKKMEELTLHLSNPDHDDIKIKYLDQDVDLDSDLI